MCIYTHVWIVTGICRLYRSYHTAEGAEGSFLYLCLPTACSPFCPLICHHSIQLPNSPHPSLAARFRTTTTSAIHPIRRVHLRTPTHETLTYKTLHSFPSSCPLQPNKRLSGPIPCHLPAARHLTMLTHATHVPLEGDDGSSLWMLPSLSRSPTSDQSSVSNAGSSLRSGSSGSEDDSARREDDPQPSGRVTRKSSASGGSWLGCDDFIWIEDEGDSVNVNRSSQIGCE